MALFVARLSAAFLAATLIASPSFSFDFPLSDEAIRQAYFLGQRHDETFALFLDKYTKHLAPPVAGPYIASVSFLTPFAFATQLSSERTLNYSAQQAELDHRNKPEIVRIVVEIALTESYGPFLSRPVNARSDSPIGTGLRRSDFWKDFRVQVLDKNQALAPLNFWGRPTYRCGYEGGCSLTGATIYFEFPAESFDSDSATVNVLPPEGDPVSVDFDLASLR